MKTILSCGLGVDSTALAVLCKQKGIMPDAVVFADTGGEKPETYHFKDIFEQWLADNGFPPLTTVRGFERRNGTPTYTLEENCLVSETLPSVVYGIKSCSRIWKRVPVLNWIKKTYPNEKCLMLLSFNADERRRMKQSEAKNIENGYPLIDFEWDRIKCLEEIAKEGLPIPAKSACFFCPSTRKNHVTLLNKKHPDLAERALKIEAVGMEKRKRDKAIGDIKGLGRHWAWKDVIEYSEAQLSLLDENHIYDCNCIESGVDIEQYWRQFT